MKTWSQHRYEVKFHAKKSLVGRYLKCIFAYVILFSFSLSALSFLPFQAPIATGDTPSPELLLSQMLPNGFTRDVILLIAITLILYLLLTAPLEVGIQRFLLLASRGEKPKFRVIFTSFLSLKQVFSAFLLNIIITILQLFWAIVLFAIPIALSAFSATLGPLAEMGSALLSILAAILFAIVCVPYILAPIALSENHECSPFKALLIARKKARGAKREFLVFRLSFIFWYLFAFNVPMAFFVRPYIDMSTVRFYDTINECK